MRICDAYNAQGFKLANPRGDWFGTKGNEVAWNLWDNKWINDDLYDATERGIPIDYSAYKLLAKVGQGGTISFFRVAKVGKTTEVIDPVPGKASILFLGKNNKGKRRVILKKIP